MDNPASNYLRPTTPEKPTLHLAKRLWVNLWYVFTLRGFACGVLTSGCVGALWVAFMNWRELLPGAWHGGTAMYDATFALMLLCDAIVLSIAITPRQIAIAKSTSKERWFDFGRDKASTFFASAVTAMLSMLPGTIIQLTYRMIVLPRALWALPAIAVISLTFFTYSLICLAPVIVGVEGLSIPDALAKSISLTRGNRVKAALYTSFSTVAWLLCYVFLLLPGVLLFEWAQRNLVSLYCEANKGDASDNQLAFNPTSAAQSATTNQVTA